MQWSLLDSYIAAAEWLGAGKAGKGRAGEGRDALCIHRFACEEAQLFSRSVVARSMSMPAKWAFRVRLFIALFLGECLLDSMAAASGANAPPGARVAES